jgi:hypothetical protein
MKSRIAVLIAAVAAAAVLACAPCHAYWVTPFRDTDAFIKQSYDIVVAKCIPMPKGEPLILSDIGWAHVEVLMTLKGEEKPGPLKVATIYEMKPGTTYLLASENGAYFRAVPELSVVPLPANCDLSVLKGMSTKQQVQRLFAAHLFEVQQKLAPLEAESDRLLRGLRDRTDDLYESRGDVHIATIHETSPQELSKSSYYRARYYLQLGSAKIEWNPYGLVPFELGLLCCHGVGKEPVSWEFAASPQREIKDFDGKPLRARFYGYLSPVAVSDSAPPGSGSGNSIVVKVGQVVLARTTADPRTVYILKIESQAQDKESVTVKYAIVRD